jgi:hypothetical protein
MWSEEGRKVGDQRAELNCKFNKTREICAENRFIRVPQNHIITAIQPLYLTRAVEVNALIVMILSGNTAIQEK